jgi:hypothetical protein
MKTSFQTRPGFLILAMLLLPLAAAADTIAINPSQTGVENDAYNANVTLGWNFTLTSPLTLLDLGYFDYGGDGLADPHPVGIWDSDGDLLASAVVPAGTAGTLVDGFRFETVAPLVLVPGDYTIGGYANVASTDIFDFADPSTVTIGGLTFGEHLYTRGDSLTMPASPPSYPGAGYFGPDFMASPIPTPEPAFWLLLSVCSIGFLGASRRPLWRRAKG